MPCRRIVSSGAMAASARSSSGGADGAFVDVEEEPSTPALAERLAAEGIQLADGQLAEICLAVDGWVAGAAAGLGRGLVLLIDYGHPAAELYDAVRRPAGTLAAYLAQRVHGDPYRAIGRQDLTAHVDVTAVERAAAGAGLGPPRHDDPGPVPRRARRGRTARRAPVRARVQASRPTSRPARRSSG